MRDIDLSPEAIERVARVLRRFAGYLLACGWPADAKAYEDDAERVLALSARVTDLEATIARQQRQIEALRDGVQHLSICRYCAEDSLEKCEGGRAAIAALAAVEADAPPKAQP